MGAYMRSSFAAVAANPMETIAGIALAVMGVLMGSYGGREEQTALVISGGVATALGGALLSWTVGKVVTKQQALNEIRSQLDLVSRNIGQASAQISQAVERSLMEGLHSDTAFALVQQAVNTIYTQVTAIQNILESPFPSQELLDTANELQDLATQLSSNGGVGATTKIASRLEQVRRNLEKNARPIRSSEVVGCPDCKKQTTVMIGQYPGSTASSTCEHCGKPLNAHRRVDGSVFARPVGQASTVRVETSCPDCSNEISFVTKAGGQETKTVCFNCGASLIAADGGPPTVNGKFDIVDGVIAALTTNAPSGRPVVACPECSEEVRCTIRRDPHDYGIHSSCMKVFRIEHKALHAWRQSIPTADETPSDNRGSKAVAH